MKRNWKLINSIVNTIAESDKDIFENLAVAFS